MSDKNGRMDEEKEIKFSEKLKSQEEEEGIGLEDILNEDSNTGRKKLDLSFLEDENIYLSDEQEETTNENEEKIMEGKKKKKCFFKRLSKPKKIAFIVGMSILAIILIVGLVIGVKLLSLLNKINDGDDIAKMSTEYVDPNYDEILANVVERDRLDQTREVSPLRKADDAYVLNNDEMSIEEQNQWLIELYNKIVSMQK